LKLKFLSFGTSNYKLLLFYYFQFVSGSWDATIKLWSTSIIPEEGAEAQLIEDLSNRKRQKVERKGFPRVGCFVILRRDHVLRQSFICKQKVKNSQSQLKIYWYL